MAFFTEPDHYVKTILSDLQGAWGCLSNSQFENLTLKIMLLRDKIFRQ
jgi:hypothetical protein